MKSRPFTPDADLIAAARRTARECKRADDRRKILDLLAELSTAADLSGGPSPERSSHWRFQAGLIQERLKIAVEKCGLVGVTS